MPVHLHIMNREKFTGDFIDLVDRHFIARDHFFVIIGGDRRYALNRARPNLLLLESWTDLYRIFHIAKLLGESQNIYFHSLLNRFQNILFAFMPLPPNRFWLIWGKDLYDLEVESGNIAHRFFEFFKKLVVRRITHAVTWIKGDYELALKHLNPHTRWVDCLLYSSNVCRVEPLPPGASGASGCRLLLGNSATRTNNHHEILDMLAKYKDDDIVIYCPLSYGEKAYAEEVIRHGRKIFGSKFRGLTEFMPYDEYCRLLEQIDVAVFNHRRQQAMGNIVKLLGMGKKVYIRSEVTTWDTLLSLEIRVFDTSKGISLEKMDRDEMADNAKKVGRRFSMDRLIADWQAVFGP